MFKRMYFLLWSIAAMLLAPMAAEASGLYNVLSYGADPTGVADSTSAINTAIANAVTGSGCVYFPGGVYKVSTLNPVSAGSLCMKGDSKYMSTIATTSSTGNVVSASGATNQISDLGFTYSGSGHRSAGAYIYSNTGWGLIQNVEMNYAYYGIDSADNTGHYDNVTMETLSQTAAAGEIFIRIGAAAGGVVVDGFFNSAFTGQLPLAGVNIWNASSNPSVTISNSDFLTTTNGLLINPSSGTVAGMMVSNTRFDTGINGIVIMLSGTAKMQRSAFVNTWTSSGTGYGVEIVTQTGTSIGGLYFTNLEAIGNGANYDDVFVDGQAGTINDVQFLGGSMSNAQNGILTIAVNNLRIEGVNAGVGGGEAGNSGAGISVNNGQNVIITGNTALGNGTDIWTNATSVVKNNNICTAGGC